MTARKFQIDHAREIAAKLGEDVSIVDCTSDGIQCWQYVPASETPPHAKIIGTATPAGEFHEGKY